MVFVISGLTVRLVVFTHLCISDILFFFVCVCVCVGVTFLIFLLIAARHPVWGLFETSAACEEIMQSVETILLRFDFIGSFP